MLNIYLSGPLFSRAEIAWGARVKAFLEDRLEEVRVFWPHEIAPCSAGLQEIFQANLKALNEADLMVAMLDGSQVDDGTAWEVGYAYARSLPAWGLRTDFRSAGDTAQSLVNCMIECSCQTVFRDVEAALAALAERARLDSQG